MTARFAQDDRFFTSDADKELLARFDAARTPRHVAIIMDGNGRWAARRGLPRRMGHKAGAKAVKESIATCLELGVGYLTIYSFSSENWRRPREEVDQLMRLFVEVLESEMDSLIEHDVRVVRIGSDQGIPVSTRDAFERAQAKTASNNTLVLVVALNYGGRQEIADATRQIAQEVASGQLAPEAICEETVSQHLYTRGIPDPDLLIRTSGEMRLSNFLLWQIAYTELWVTPVLWPDFTRGDLLEGIVEYQARSRRFGGR